MKRYFSKMRGQGDALPPTAKAAHIAWSFAGGFIAIAALAYLALHQHQPLIMASFGASCVLIFGFPDSPFSQPRNVVGGHFIATLSGLLYMMNFGVTWWSMALALATAIALMQITKTVHPPAGSNPLIVMLAGAGWPFLAMPSLLGSIILVGVALIFNNLAKDRRYPRYWV